MDYVKMVETAITVDTNVTVSLCFYFVILMMGNHSWSFSSWYDMWYDFSEEAIEQQEQDRNDFILFWLICDQKARLNVTSYFIRPCSHIGYVLV